MNRDKISTILKRAAACTLAGALCLANVPAEIVFAAENTVIEESVQPSETTVSPEVEAKAENSTEKKETVEAVQKEVVQTPAVEKTEAVQAPAVEKVETVKETAEKAGENVEYAEIEDEKVRTAILESLEKDADYKITKADMKDVKTLFIRYASSLKGLKECTNLESIYISFGKMKDINELASCTKLNYVQVYDSLVEDVSALSNCKNLGTAYLYANEINSIEALRNLDNLTYVNIGNNQIKDISPLMGKTSLTRLNLQSFKLDADSLKVINSLTGLNVLHLRGCGIKNADLGFLKNMPNLQQLSLYNNGLTDIEFLRSYPHLTGIDIGGNSIQDFSPIGSLKELKFITLSNIYQNFGRKTTVTSRTVKNPYVNVDGSPIAPKESKYYTYNAATNEITFLGDTNKCSVYYTFEVKVDEYERRDFNAQWDVTIEEPVIDDSQEVQNPSETPAETPAGDKVSGGTPSGNVQAGNTNTVIKGTESVKTGDRGLFGAAALMITSAAGVIGIGSRKRFKK